METNKNNESAIWELKTSFELKFYSIRRETLHYLNNIYPSATHLASLQVKPMFSLMIMYFSIYSLKHVGLKNI